MTAIRVVKACSGGHVWCGFALACALAAPPVRAGEEPVDPVRAARGWRYEVVARDLSGVDNIAVAPGGEIYVTLELGRGRGQVLRLGPERHQVQLGGLQRPDGMLLAGKTLYVAEEVSDGSLRAIDLASGQARTIASLRNPEGIALLRDGKLVVTEDRVSGRLLRVHPATGATEVIVAGLNRPEGVSVARDGTIFIAETGTGRVLAWRGGMLDTVLDDLDEPDQLRHGSDDSLWITEDSAAGRLLRLKDGVLEVILGGLAFPQGIAFRRDGAVLVAEQGRGRILAVFPPPAP